MLEPSSIAYIEQAVDDLGGIPPPGEEARGARQALAVAELRRGEAPLEQATRTFALPAGIEGHALGDRLVDLEPGELGLDAQRAEASFLPSLDDLGGELVVVDVTQGAKPAEHPLDERCRGPPRGEQGGD